MLRYIILFVSALAHLEAAYQYISLGDNVRYYQSTEDLYYVMEKVTTEAQAQLWIEFFEIMENGRIRPTVNLSKSIWPKSVNRKSITFEHMKYLRLNKVVNVDGVNNKIRSGAEGAAQGTVRSVFDTFTSDNPVELWICYAWSSTETPTGPASVEDLMKIEMAVTVTTRAPFLYTWHMGITRNALWKQAPDVKIHPGISVPIHSFAARVMSDEHPELYYVMSAPMVGMLEIFKKALAPHIGHTVFFSWYGENGVIQQIGRSLCQLYTLSESPGGRQLIFEGSYEEFNWPRHPGSSFKYFVADIRTLANAVTIDE